MAPTIRPAATDAEREAIYRLRYDVYVEEMQRHRAAADHERRWLKEPDDETSRLYLAEDESGAVVGTMRLTWGGDAPFTNRHVEQYDLGPFIAEVPLEQMIVGERFMVTKAFRGSNLIFRMFCAYLEFCNQHRIQLIFGDSEPHLLNLYQGLGFRTYTKRNVNSPSTGYLIPLVMVPEDVEYMRRINSPLASVLQDFGPDARVPDCVPRLIGSASAVISSALTPGENYWQQINQALALAETRVKLFDGLTDEQARKCISKSNTIECRIGDRLIKKGNVAQNMYVVLSGALTVRDGDTLIAVLTAGDIVGEMAFLLESPRTMDVYAATDDVRVLSLSESTIRKMVDNDPESAAKLLINVSKMLCYKLLRQTS